ncbi:MAG: ATP cone domain-containing protein, partial [Oscillospiraceae bacterium]
MIEAIRKRDGREVEFNIEKIANAIYKAAEAIGGKDYKTSLELANDVVEYIEDEMGISKPNVEQIQDEVEKILVDDGH